MTRNIAHRTVHLPIAQPTAGQIVPELALHFDEPVPDLADLEAMRAFYRDRAVEIRSALLDSAPQGLVDALLVELLAHHVSLARVPYPSSSSRLPRERRERLGWRVLEAAGRLLGRRPTGPPPIQLGGVELDPLRRQRLADLMRRAVVR